LSQTARRHDIDAEVADGFSNLTRDAGPARGVFDVGDHQVDAVAIHQRRQRPLHEFASRLAHDIADKENLDHAS
jgi:hypothetical protein